MLAPTATCSRRSFIASASLAVAGGTLARANTPAATPVFQSLGIAAPLEKAAEMKDQGAQFLTLGVADLLAPDQPGAVFEENLKKLTASALPVLACNGFIRPKHLHCTGPEANHELILEWADTCFRRMKRTGGRFIVFGSGSARSFPDGWSREKADAQFISLLKRMGPLAEAQGITVTIEQLKAQECNYINHIHEGAAVIRAANHPNIRLLADLHHMAVMGDTPEDLKQAMDVVAHMEIAEKEGRTVPGVNGDDFRPFFRVARDASYQGSLSIEGHSKDQQVAAAFREIKRQCAEL